MIHLVSHEPTLDDIQTELIDLANFMCKLAKIEPIPLKFKNVKSYSGRAFLNKRYIAISSIELYDEHNGIINKHFNESVVIHEICHFIYLDWHKKHGYAARIDHHGNTFKAIETYWLEQFGMVPEYKGIYIRKLSKLDGTILWSV